MNHAIAFMLAWKLISLFLSPPPEHYLTTGNQLYQQGKYHEAETVYQKVFTDSRQAGRAYYNAGNAAYHRKDYPLSASYYEKALEIDPQDEDAWHNLEMARRRMPAGEESDQRNGAGSSLGSPSPHPNPLNHLLEASREREKQSLRIRQPKRSGATRGLKRDFFNLPPEELMQMMRQRMENNYMFQPAKPSRTMEEPVPDEIDW
jgi:tetratricopeptide (TPR) repeat protein